MIARRLLQILEDVPGVTGSFVMAPSGELLVHSLPPQFELEELKLTACRIARILQCAGANGLQAEDGLFDFGEGKLLVREFVRGYLCVLCQATVSMRSLRLTTRLVARSMPAELRVMDQELGVAR